MVKTENCQQSWQTECVQWNDSLDPKFRDIKVLRKALSNHDFKNTIDEIKNLLSESMVAVHRLPIVIQSIVINIKEEMMLRVDKHEKN